MNEALLKNLRKIPFEPNESERYYSANRFFTELFGGKTYKLSLDAGFGCPNRDGTVGRGGCIFCSEGGSGDFAVKITENDVDCAIAQAKEKVAAKTTGNRFIAYLQSYTNTYAPTEKLDALYSALISRSDIRALSIATRPDCLGDDVCRLIARLAKQKPVFVELGLQTSNEQTAKLINRGYALPVYDEGVKKLKSAGANVITHIIVGLPNETKADVLKTLDHSVRCGTDGVKIQLLHVLKNTKLAELYDKNGFKALTKQEYIEALCDCVNALPKNVIIHRLTGDAPKKLLIEPQWSANKKDVLNSIKKAFAENNVLQGSKPLGKNA